MLIHWLWNILRNSQDGCFNQQLQEPIKILVKNNLGVGQPGVLVYFKISGGGGSVSNFAYFTDHAGIAQTNSTLGNTGANSLTSEIRNTKDTVLNSVKFNANAFELYEYDTMISVSARLPETPTGIYINKGGYSFYYT